MDEVLSHSRFRQGFDIMLKDTEGKTVGVEVKSICFTSHLMTAIGQCVCRLARNDADEL